MRLKLTVETGFVGGEHIDYEELPEDWDKYSEPDRQKFIRDCCNDFIHDVCDVYGEIVEDE